MPIPAFCHVQEQRGIGRGVQTIGGYVQKGPLE